MLAKIFFITLIVSRISEVLAIWRHWGGAARTGIRALSGAFKPYSQFNRKKAVYPKMRHFCAKAFAARPGTTRRNSGHVAFRTELSPNKPRKGGEPAHRALFFRFGPYQARLP
jgi:hypothetical protein